MEDPESPPGSPGDATAALQPMTPDRVNQQRDSSLSTPRSDHHRDSSIHDKIQQFNNMSRFGPQTAASMTKQLERKTADAALKRAMLGREEAESDMRRFREETRLLRKQIEEGKERERRVGERLETVMENYGRAKETYAHTQALWEKEIRRARKETFKSQSTIVKLQEEVKAARVAGRATEEVLEREKERSQAREQEAFTARYQLVGIQEKLQQALECIKVLEQERDAFKTLAHNEEVARIAAEGRLPLPQPEDSDDEFASPKKRKRVSITKDEIVSSATSEAEIDELTRLWHWERQRADRAQQHLEFLEAECHLRSCACTKSRSRRSLLGSARKPRPEPIAIVDPADYAILGKKPESPAEPACAAEETVIHHPVPESPTEDGINSSKLEEPKQAKGSRQSLVYVPAEGTFRTLSQTELDVMEIDDPSHSEPLTPADPVPQPVHYARTPSLDPPTFAMLRQERTSLMSLLNAPREEETDGPVFNIPTTPGSYATTEPDVEQSEQSEQDGPATLEREEAQEAQEASRPHTSAACYAVATTTTTVPLREDENVDPRDYAKSGQRTLARTPSFDVNNPALTPTMTREQALAQIRERRGRARSAAQGAATPRKQMVTGGGERRDVSAPAGRAARGKS